MGDEVEVEEGEDPGDDEREPVPGLEELLRRNLEGGLQREEPGPKTVVAGTWELRRLLGAGGFGKVWEAWHLELDQPVAIKILDARHEDAEVRQRFVEEARLMAGMASDHLVRVSDLGELPDGTPYFVMELVKGQTLRHRLRERMSVTQIEVVTEELLEGLAAVHRCGVVHGDIKPENVILGQDGKTRLLDFGLARTTGAARGRAGGTPPYMAPEMVLEGAPAGVRTDVYAVGVVLYEMLTGRLPRGHVDMDFERIREAWQRKPKASSIRLHGVGVLEASAETVDALDRLVMEALAHDPAARFESAQQMLDELRSVRRPGLSVEAMATTLTPESGAVRSRAIEGRTITATPGRPRRTWLTLGMAVGTVAFVAAVTVATWWMLREPAASVVVPTTEAQTPVATELERARAGIFVAIPQDAGGTAETAYAAFCAALDGNRPRVEGVAPVYCQRVAAGSTPEALLEQAESAGVAAVVLVGDESLVVRSTSHDRRHPLLARLDRLPLPTDPATLEQVAPLLRALVGASGATEVEIPMIALDRVGPQWLVLAEWLRAQQGHAGHEDLVRREQLASKLDRMLAQGEDVAFHRDLAVHLWASGAGCEAARQALDELTERGRHEPEIRVMALLEKAGCLVEGRDAASRLAEARALLDEAFAASGDRAPCVRVAAIGTISRIDRLKGDDALWQANAPLLPGRNACEPAMWSKVLAVRGDALAERERWCDAATAYAQAYGLLRTRLLPLLNWAEHDWKCDPKRGPVRQELLDELGRAQQSERFGRPEQRVSVAYLRWWLTQDPADAERVAASYAAVEPGEPGLIEDVASTLAPELCDAARQVAEDAECSRAILARPKRTGDEPALRRSLGLR